MAWVYLLAAGLCEIAWAVGLKTYGFRLGAGTAFTLFMMLISFSLLSLAMRTLPLGTAYGIWTGIGAVGAVLFGMIFLGEPRDVGRLLCIGAIVAGIVGLKVLTPVTAGEARGFPVNPSGLSPDAPAQAIAAGQGDSRSGARGGDGVIAPQTGGLSADEKSLEP